jgi:NADH-quinone oxidoreductase subunit J
MMVVFFTYFALMSMAAAVLTVALRNPVHCGLALLALLLHVSGLFVLLNAEFLWAVQVVVYAGAILVLYLFVLMLLNLKTDERYFHSTYLYFVIPTLLGSLYVLALLFKSPYRGAKGDAPPGAVLQQGDTYAIGMKCSVITCCSLKSSGFFFWAPSLGQSCWRKHRNLSAGERTVTCEE